MDNYEKNERYSELMEKLKKSIEEEFYYEAIFIVYAILEDRTESILRHANIDNINDAGRSMTLNEKLNIINNNSKFKNDYIEGHLTRELINKIHIWKNRRNILIHDLINVKYNNEQIRHLAIEGYDLIKRINNKSTLINKYNDKKFNDYK